MFFAQALYKTIYSNYQTYLNKNQECLFPYKSKHKNRSLLAEIKPENPHYTHIQLKKMSKQEYLKYFSKQNLLKKWDRKCKVNYRFKVHKFSNEFNDKTFEAKKYIKNLVDKDIFEKKTPRWNNSTKPSDNKSKAYIKEHIKNIKYEADHCFKNKISKRKINDNYQQNIIHDDINNGWNVSSKLERKERNIKEKELYLKSMSNTQKYWLKNINKFNNVGIKEKEIMNSTMGPKMIKLFEEKKHDPGDFDKYTSKQKYLKKNESCDCLFKKKSKDISNIIKYKKAQNQWKDKELSEKIKLIEDWSEQSICNMNNTYRVEELKKEMLKKLIYNKEEIKKTQEKIKQENHDKNRIKNKIDSQNNKSISSIYFSKYPLCQKRKSIKEKSGILNEEQGKNDDENKIFIEACKKLILDEEIKNRNLKRCSSSKNIKKNIGKIIYFHPGIYREFIFIINLDDNVEKNDNDIKEEKYTAWSCCNNMDKNSKGCEKKFIKFDTDNEFIFFK